MQRQETAFPPSGDLRIEQSGLFVKTGNITRNIDLSENGLYLC